MEEYAGIALVPMIVGVSEIAKSVGLSTKYIPILNFLLGIIMGVFIFDVSIQLKILYGLGLGLSASGLWSSGKHMAREFGSNTPVK